MNVIKSLLSDKSFWAAVIALVAAVLVAFNVPQGSVTQITAFIAGIGTIIAYIVNNGVQSAAQIKAGAQIEAARAAAEKR